MRSSRRGIPGIVYVDFLAAIVAIFVALLFLALVQVKQRQTLPPALRTPGLYAVVISWPGRLDDDVDLYVRDARGNIVFFANPTAGLLNLEYDDLGDPSSVTDTGAVVRHKEHVERIVVRGLQQGEFTANVHLYRHGSTRPVRVTATLWKLFGADRPITQVSVTLQREGDEETLFRFTVEATGEVGNLNRLPARFVGSATSGGDR